ncbi:replication protein C [Microvirga sp. BT688]|uniref:plasmid replication protein RepC n=1 Tax=Microvirga sp. TaxID=1873136 RepID=UPI00168856F1|nr:plasmid replication protein RepC [Microvirga sp.]MBD2746150.1 replication protein C [Microvirga sp.]
MQLASSGGRRLRHAALAARELVLETGRTVTRKELSAAAREAAKALELRNGPRSVLSELVACWGEQEWERLLVWPSNDYLVSRTGMSERGIRKAFRVLIDQQLIVPKESPNGKRYAVKDLAGEIVDAFGFDLTPVYARRGEWAERIVEQRQLRETRKRTFDEITIARRAAQEALNSLTLEFPDLDRSDLEERLAGLLARTPLRSTKAMPLDILDEWKSLRRACEEAYYQTGYAGTGCRHTNNNNGSPTETCNKGFPKKAEAVRSTEQTSEHLSPELILEACPTLSDYGQPVRDLADIVAAGRYLRAALGANESAWAEAIEGIGTVRAAIAVIYTLQLYENDLAKNGGESRIKNPGGYYRALVRMVKSGKIDLAVELLAMRRRRMS